MGASKMESTMMSTSGAACAVSWAPDDIDYAAIMQLMTAKHTCELVDRHVAAIRKVCKTCCNGFLLKHLEPLVELLKLVVRRLSEGQHVFALAICEITRVASQPFVSCKASDMITYGHFLPSFVKVLVSVLNYALPIPDEVLAAAMASEDPDDVQAIEERKSMNERIRIEIAHTLACWSRFGLEQDTTEVQPHQPLIEAVADSGTPNLRILRQSQVLDALSSSFRAEDSPEAVIITLGAIRDMSLYRPLARQITNSGLISNLVHVIRVNLLGSDVLLVAAEVLWNVLELDWQAASEALGQEEVVECFRDFMGAVLSRGYRFKDKIFRNDMMVLLMYISKREENRPLFAKTGLMALLLSHAGGEARRKVLHDSGVLRELLGEEDRPGPSLGNSPSKDGKQSRVASVALTNSQEDMEFRMLLWGTLSRCCSSEPCAQVAVRCGFVPALLANLDQQEMPQEQRQWTSEQRRKVQLEALSSLFQLVQYVPDAFLEASGNSIVLQLLQATRSREVQRKCLNLLQVAVRMGPKFPEELGQLGAVGLLIELFTDKDNPMGSRQLCASVLAGLCAENAENRREFRKKDGVEAIRAEVVYRPDETTDNHLFYTLCVVDCVWSAVVGTRKNEIRFLDSGGLFSLLDVLEVSPLLLKRQIIGCLADLLLYRKAAKAFTQWNSQATMKGALKILLELWQSEQEAAGSMDKDGVVRELSRPLNPQEPPSDNNDWMLAADRPESRGSNSSMNSSKASMRLRQARNFADVAAASMRSKGSVQFPSRINFGGQQQSPTSINANIQSLQGKGCFKGGRGGGGATVAAAAATASAPKPAPAVAAHGFGRELLDRQDSRAKIHSVLRCIGFESQEALTIAERQQMELVKLFPTAAELETWIQVQSNLEQRGLKPIAADLKWIEDAIADRQSEAGKVQALQRKLADERRSEELAGLNRFYEDIRGRAQIRRGAMGGDGGDEFLGGLPSMGSDDDDDGFSSGDNA
eukprot:CAMPEP_0206544990 /NCGR_PEP_ID=MMETSP0325_2-20121206/11866_1 /ASSEMBLY_ACC=CAM_ASM_000347 /TAXON_ID=2866 /ORGANISM="Crypthecodinium cohnii, Strain Seligo" /LENGTH=983 /DNA_ID=CAMNT_0054043883 /DNA_START=330 /DNA_END=3281 /DNA_ORIENTATION=-